VRQSFLPLLARAVVLVALLYLVVPLVAVIPLSLTDQRLLTLPVHELSMKHYQTLFGNADWLDAAWQSLQIAVAVTVVAVSAGTASAIGCWLIGNPTFFRVLNLLPIMVPYIIFALGAYRLFAWIGLLDTVPGVIIVHVIGAIPFVFISVSTNLEYVDRSLVRAARSLGARPLRAAITIVLPNVKTGLFSGAVFAFLHSWDEIVVTLFVSGRSVTTLPRKMWDGLHDDLSPVIACVAVILIAITVSLLTVEQRINRTASPPKGTA
jgi:putative spermidine/putrescine transport system permease protein